MRKLVEVATKSKFIELIQNATEYLNSIVFIKDTKEIWTHGVYYTGQTFYTEITPTVNLSTSWTKLLTLDMTEAGTYLIQAQYGGVYYSGEFSYVPTIDSSSNFIQEEIPLHASGCNNFPDGNQHYARIFLKIGTTTENNVVKPALMVSATKNDGNCNINIKIKQIL